MSTFMVERSFDESMDLEAVLDRAAGSLKAHHVRHLESYVSRDGRRMTTLYQAPDVESVRAAQEEAGLAFDRVWPAQVIRFSGPEAPRDVVLVERTLPEAVDEAGIRDLAAKGAECVEEWGCRHLTTYLSDDGYRCLCVYEAPDTESVRQAMRAGILPYERAWPSRVHQPPHPPDKSAV